MNRRMLVYKLLIPIPYLISVCQRWKKGRQRFLVGTDRQICQICQICQMHDDFVHQAYSQEPCLASTYTNVGDMGVHNHPSKPPFRPVPGLGEVGWTWIDLDRNVRLSIATVIVREGTNDIPTLIDNLSRLFPPYPRGDPHMPVLTFTKEQTVHVGQDSLPGYMLKYNGTRLVTPGDLPPGSHMRIGQRINISGTEIFSVNTPDNTDLPTTGFIFIFESQPEIYRYYNQSVWDNIIRPFRPNEIDCNIS